MLAPDARRIVLDADFEHLADRSLVDMAIGFGRHVRAWLLATLR